MIISIFGDTVVKPGVEEAEARLDARLVPILRRLPGFISYKEYVAEDGEAIGILRFETREALDAWVHEGAHEAAQHDATEYFESFWIQSAETFREYRWQHGDHIDGDLTDLFLERGSDPS